MKTLIKVQKLSKTKFIFQGLKRNTTTKHKNISYCYLYNGKKPYIKTFSFPKYFFYTLMQTKKDGFFNHMFHMHMRYILLHEIYKVGKNLEWAVLEGARIKS